MFHPHQALSIICGDFNFVEHNHDRITEATGKWSGHTDEGAAKAWNEHVAGPFGLHEWSQPQFTHTGSGARSRLDRVYCNQHIAFQLDRNCVCTRLECDHDVSHHHPISFARTTPRPKSGDDKPLSPKDLAKDGWGTSVIFNFQRNCLGDRDLENPIRRLVLLKDAIKETTKVYRNIEEFNRTEKLGPDDKQGYTMTCLRARERDDMGCVFKCGVSYPRLLEWTNHLQKDINNTSYNQLKAQALIGVREHAIVLAQEGIGDDIEAIRNSEESDPGDKARAKESVVRKLKRLVPGESTGINAMKNSDGAIVTSPEEIAQVLKQHWGGVLKGNKSAQRPSKSGLRNYISRMKMAVS